MTRLVTAVNDGFFSRPLEGFIRNAELPAVQEALKTAFLPTDKINIPFTTLVVETGGKLVLLDTGQGEFGPPTSGTWMNNFRAAGYDPAKVTDVIISHFHGDHINGVRKKDGTLSFANAQLHVPAPEYAFWMSDERMNAAPEISAGTGRTDWKFEQRAAVLSLVTTGGGLLFGGDVAGRFRAYDQKSGSVLWQVNLGSQVTGFPISYAVGERQFIAVSTGSAVNTAQYLRLTPEIRAGNQNALFVFALPDGWQATAGSAGPRPGGAPAAAIGAAAPSAGVALPAAVAASAGTSSCRRDVSKPAVRVGQSARGRFSPSQLREGRRLYAAQQCVTCHGESLRGSPGAPPLADAGFRQAWAGRSLRDLFDCTRTTMPPGQAGRLTDAEYVALLAVMLDANGYAAGGEAAGLPADPDGLGRLAFD